MPKQKNIDSVNKLKEKVGKAKAIYLMDYRGLTHKQLEDLHKMVKKVQGEFVVVKNSLLRLALGQTQGSAPTMNNEPSSTMNLTGPTAILLAYEEEITPLKELYKFIKTNSLPVAKLGFIGANQYSSEDVVRLSKLPGRQELQAQMVGRLSGPMYGLLYALNGNLQKLVYVLTRIQANK